MIRTISCEKELIWKNMNYVFVWKATQLDISEKQDITKSVMVWEVYTDLKRITGIKKGNNSYRLTNPFIGKNKTQRNPKFNNFILYIAVKPCAGGGRAQLVWPHGFFSWAQSCKQAHKWSDTDFLTKNEAGNINFFNSVEGKQCVLKAISMILILFRF